MTSSTAGSAPARQDRREAICDAAVELAAAGGNRAVTHHGVDDRLGIARGSTSYYYRTRRDLLQATVTRLAARSRAALDSAPVPPSAAASAPLDAAADFISAYLDELLGPRRSDALARYALAADSAVDETVRPALAGCLFSVPAATELLAGLGAGDPAQAAQDLISLLEGLLFDRLHGNRSTLGLRAGTAAGIADLRPVVHRWLTTAVYRDA
ncbi:TetR/AcrR family transcriptional regulator [Nocardia stercoris]|uniref:TetR/AcrR family transcriptional regulator n=1 Tax=Nocardia stercoris TaxID=2483361 RepID=A0A3M2L6I7_9NOCA|nr:TetR family transcriptional regulator [Nocardia stercoris]RMI32954.1 TetR/AcrR family transcriptional regulator [Nocardia stercoris]